MMAAPKIRFKGFAGDWEQRKLGEVVSVFDGTHQTPNYIKSGIMFLSVENINTLQSEKFISEEDFDKEFKIFPEYGDILMTRIGDIGTANVVRSNNKIAYYVSLALMKSQQVDSDFLVAAISSENMQLEIWKRTLHVAFPKKINKNEIDKLNIVIPQKDEQQKIGNFFRTLDDTITLHKRKLDGLKELKKGYLQQMFPRTGDSVPRVRFAGFSRNWESRKLIQIADYRNGKAHEKNITTDDRNSLVIGKYIVVNSKFISTNGEVKKYTDEQIEPLLLDEIAFVLSDVPNGRAISRTFLVDENNRYSLNQRIAGITPHNDTDCYFLYLLMNRNPYFLKFDDGVGQTNLSKGEVENFVSMYPCYEEQTAIGSFFRSLDEQIVTQQTKLDKLKQLKAAYLQNMFV